MNDTRSCEVPAVKYDELDTAPAARYLFITDMSAFWGGDKPEWAEEGILDAMSWSDVSDATSEWSRAAVVCPELSMKDIAVGDFWKAWTHWTRHMSMDLSTRLELRFWHPQSRFFTPDYAHFGPDDATRKVVITFYTREFFSQFRSSSFAWKEIVCRSLTQSGSTYGLFRWDFLETMAKAQATHLVNGGAIVYASDPPEDDSTVEVFLLDNDGARAFVLPQENLDPTEKSDY